jgi:hypothetical protein
MSKPMSLEEAAALERDCLLDPEPLESAAPTPAARGKPRRAQRLQPLPGPFARTPLQWLTKPHLPCPFRYDERLFLYLSYKSYGGQKEVRVTNELAAEIGVPARAKQRAIAKFARTGWLRIVRQEEPSHTTIIVMLVHSG